MVNRARCAFLVLVATVAIGVGSPAVMAKSCQATYTARRGDSWWSIASKSNTTLKQILKLNGASMSTLILIGREVCVPAAAKPATPARVYNRNEVEQIIREIWPDDLEARALAIADRESNLNPLAKNRCCYGLFQIYYTYHKNWLPSVGVTSANQLLDPRLNTLAAYTLYKRNNGWGPWE